MPTTEFYAQPRQVDDVLLAFPATLGDLLPPEELIPADYSNRRAWLRFQHDWFVGALPADCEMHAADGIDAEVAGRHLSAIQRSFESKHQHKAAAVAWLASRWFTRITAPDDAYSCP
ncbi:MAG: hypothetical protein PHQ28_00795 [Mycobacterium sp.]|nr:hypothetical protein [Mycobacterium sp.]